MTLQPIDADQAPIPVFENLDSAWQYGESFEPRESLSRRPVATASAQSPLTLQRSSVPTFIRSATEATSSTQKGAESIRRAFESRPFDPNQTQWPALNVAHTSDVDAYSGTELPLRQSPFQVARSLSGEGAQNAQKAEAARFSGVLNPDRFGVASLVLQGRADGEPPSTLEQVLHRTSWKPFESDAQSPMSNATRAEPPVANLPGRIATGEARSLPLTPNASLSGTGSLPAPAFSPMTVMVQPGSGQTKANRSASLGVPVAASRKPFDSALPLSAPRSSQTSSRADAQVAPQYQQAGIQAERQNPSERAIEASSSDSTAPDLFPTVLRRAMAGPESKSWTDSGPTSPIWGDLGRLVQSQPIVTASENPPAYEWKLKTGTVDRTPASHRAALSPAAQRRTPAGTSPRWSPPTKIEESFPPVHRSALVDRSEPGEQQLGAAHEMMSSSLGSPLPPLVRRSMEERLGSDFGSVRVHSGPSIARASELLAARAMSRGNDVFMPSGVPDRPDPDTMPLLAHELSHVSSHLGQPVTPLRRSPLVLAQRSSSEEHRAEQVERAVSSEMQSRFPGIQSGMPTAMSLARGVTNTISPSMPLSVARIETPAPIQRDESGASQTATVSQVVPDAPGTSAVPPDTGEIAEKVYALLERRLVIERERGGFRRP